MNLQDINALQNALKKLESQLKLHQQNKAIISNVNALINKYSEENSFNVLSNLQNMLSLTIAAMCDEHGLGKLNLMLYNAKVPPKYYDIFYGLLAQNSAGGGGLPICIDGGAHAGLISDIAAHCGAEVYAFEPNLHLQSFLKRKFKDKNVHLFQKALAHKNYTTSFLIFQGRALSQGNRIVSSTQDKETAQSYKVEVIDLCEFIEQFKGREIYLLKLDIEGAEFEILEKLIAKKLYKNIKFIACETHEYMFKDGRARLKRIQKLIKQENITNILLDWV